MALVRIRWRSGIKYLEIFEDLVKLESDPNKYCEKIVLEGLPTTQREYHWRHIELDVKGDFLLALCLRVHPPTFPSFSTMQKKNERLLSISISILNPLFQITFSELCTIDKIVCADRNPNLLEVRSHRL